MEGKMTCSNCGASLTREDKFCALCGKENPAFFSTEEALGKEVPEDMIQKEDGSRETVRQPEDGSKKPKKKKGFKIGVVAAAAVAVVAVSLAGARIYQSAKKAMMSPLEYYQYVEAKNRDENKQDWLGYYDAVYGGLNEGAIDQKSSITMQFSDTAKSLLSLSGLDLSALKNACIDISAKQEDTVYIACMQAKINDQSLATLKMYLDREKDELYYQIPEFTESYIDASAALSEINSDRDLNALWNNFYTAQQYFPATKDLEAIWTRYTDIAIESAENVEQEEQEISVQDVTQTVTAFTITMSEEDSVTLYRDILEEAKEDENIKNIIEIYAKDAYTSYQSRIEEALNSLQETGAIQDGGELELKVYVDAEDVIVGRELNFPGGDIVISSLCPQDGETFGSELSYTENGITYAVLTGSGTKKDEVIDGSFSLALDEAAAQEAGLVSAEGVLKIELADCDTSAIADGAVSGTYTFSSDAVTELTNYSLKIVTDGDAESSESTVSILAGQQEMLTMDISSSADAVLEVEDVKPSNNDTVYNIIEDETQLSAYMSEISLEAYLQKMEDATGIDFTAIYNEYAQ